MPARLLCPPRRLLLFALAAALALAPSTRAGFVLFVATTDNSGGSKPVVVPGHNPNLPAISAGVTMTPGIVKLNGLATGPLNGVTYGPYAYGGNAGGSTGFVHISFTIPSTYQYALTWEVADVLDSALASAVATDNVALNGTTLFGFESGIPGGFTTRGSTGTSGAIPNLAPTEGSSFAYLDTTGPATVPPLFDRVHGTNASRMLSSNFTAHAGDVLSLDTAFLTNDGGNYADYGIVALSAVPEPAGLILLGSGAACLLSYRTGRRRRAGRAPG